MLFHHSMPVPFGHAFPILPFEGDTDIVLWALAGQGMPQDCHIVIETSVDGHVWEAVATGDAGSVGPVKTSPTAVLFARVRAHLAGGADNTAPDGSVLLVLSSRPLGLEPR